ncbi:MAG: Inositol monophosphatase family protein [Candidatus Tokpelaia hoelldobleri]|uniref:Inositol monophosphatase family protein n=1 Tax=Candidatus Tokpelaia hoelldobleri TaxID=1902579 RepID=A0A1U9JVZ8_9HYPH|nr:MAG: Inositol monophosphatase family protein [Candidatus Tokpelaia hoelldoblerii]
MPVNSPAPADDLALLSHAAREAGAIAMRYFGHAPDVWIKEGNSPVSEADFAVDAFLKRTLLAARPDYGWISEETADERQGQTFRRTFIVDPIDGTRGFLEKRADWCVSVAVVEDGRPLAGVLECPAKAEHYSAREGKPALCNGEVIRVATREAHEQRRISCRTSIAKRLPAACLPQLTFEKHVSSLAYRLALLSRGTLDGVFIRPDCHDWDIAAADLILRQSGGILCTLDKQPVSYQKVPFCHGFLVAGGVDMIDGLLEIAAGADL